DRIDTYNTEYQFLGCGDVLIPGARNLVDARDRVRAESEGRDRLRAADSVDLSDIQFTQRSGDGRILKQRAWGSRDDEPPDACHLSRHDIHHHRRRIRRRATGNVKADA